MKITKTSIEENIDREIFKRAHDGCDRCPCCYITNEELIAPLRKMAEDSLGARMALVRSSDRFYRSHRKYDVGLFKPVTMVVDEYKCPKCGAQWESDPYENRLSIYSEVHW